MINGKVPDVGHFKKINEFIALFLCTASAIAIIFADFVIEKSGISEYMMRDEKRVADHSVKNIVTYMSLIIFVGPMLVFTRYSKIE